MSTRVAPVRPVTAPQQTNDRLLSTAAAVGADGMEVLGATDFEPLHERARLRWPRIALSTWDYSRFLESKIGGRDSPKPLLKHGLDLYLAGVCLLGVPEAIVVLEQEYLDRIPAVLKTFPDSEDLRQAVLERLLLGRGSRPGKLAHYAGRSSLHHWLRVVITRVVLNVRRTGASKIARRSDEGVEELDACATTDPETAYLQRLYVNEFAEVLQESLASLDERSRLLLRLHTVERTSGQEIASRLGVSRGTVVRWLSGVRERLTRDTFAHLTARLGLPQEDLRRITPLVLHELDAEFARHCLMERSVEASLAV